MCEELRFSREEARRVWRILGLECSDVDFEQFYMGMNVELEHGTRYGRISNVTNNDPVMTGRIALAHLYEIDDYYTRLDRMEKRAEKDERKNKKSKRSKRSGC